MKLILFIISLLCWLHVCNAQDSDPRPGTRKHDLMAARSQILGLKNGVLLVRLPTRKQSIDALRRGGNVELAERLEAEQRIRNQQLIGTFEEYFDFCAVYFFFSDQSESVRSGELGNVIFVNEGLEIDTTINITAEFFLTAEISTLVQDTARYYSHTGSRPTGHFRHTDTPRYYGSTAMGFEGLVIKSDQFIQLKRPFPYYVRTFSSLPFKRGIRKTVSRMNRKLHGYHARMQQ